MTQPLLQSSEDRPSYPLEEKYTLYSQDMYKLYRFSKSIFNLVNFRYTFEYEFITGFYVSIDFKEGSYEVHESGIELISSRKLTKEIDVHKFFSFSNFYDFYLYLKLLYDNDLRLTQVAS